MACLVKTKYSDCMTGLESNINNNVSKDNSPISKLVGPLNKINWKKKHLKSIEINYSKTKYFNDYIDFFREFYEKNWIYLAEMNEYFLKYILQELQIKTEIISDRDLNFREKKNRK